MFLSIDLASQTSPIIMFVWSWFSVAYKVTILGRSKNHMMHFHLNSLRYTVLT